MEPMEIIRAAEAHDGVAPFSEQFLSGLADTTLGHTHHMVEAGIAAVAPDGAVELVVHPAHRRQGKATELLSLIDAPVNPKIWAHGNLPAAQAFASAHGLHPTRELLVMGVDAGAIRMDLDAALPPGVEAVTYSQGCARWGKEGVDKQWLRVNNDAFSWHPEQGGWDEARLERAMAAEWFDPDGVWFLVRDGEIGGFHWTKRHAGDVGEVYVVGLASAWRGEGMGVPLMQVGLKHLVEGGSSQVILYVEADNQPAVKRYNETGFTIRERHVVYEFPAR